MSFVIATPDAMAATAAQLETIGSALDAAHELAASRTLQVVPAAADEVSTSIAQLFAQSAEEYQAVARGAAAFGDQFVGNLKASAASYAGVEDVIAGTLRAIGANIQHLLTTDPGSLVGEFFSAAINGSLALLNQLPPVLQAFINFTLVYFFLIGLGAVLLAAAAVNIFGRMPLAAGI